MLSGMNNMLDGTLMIRLSPLIVHQITGISVDVDGGI